MSNSTSSPADVLTGNLHDPWRIPLLDPAQFEMQGAAGNLCREQLKYLACFGLLAPTTHNTVPQRFRLVPESQRIDVLVDRKYVLPESDPRGRQCLVSLGCVLANIESAAKALGSAPRVVFSKIESDEVTALPPNQAAAERFRQVFSIVFEPGAPSGDIQLLELMRSRKVLRAEYDRTAELGDQLERDLHAIAAPFQNEARGPQLHLIRAPLMLKALGKFQEQADRFVLENPRFANELGQWLLPNGDTSSTRGMRGQEFGFDDAFSEHVHHALQGRRQLLPDQLAGFAKGGKLGLESSTAVAVISVSADEPAQQLLAGRAAQLMALQLSRHGFHTAFHAALTEVDWVSTMFATSVLRTRRRPMVLLRLGKPKRATDLARPHAARPMIDDLILA